MDNFSPEDICIPYLLSYEVVAPLSDASEGSTDPQTNALQVPEGTARAAAASALPEADASHVKWPRRVSLLSLF